jgi:hypothetical protein
MKLSPLDTYLTTDPRENGPRCDDCNSGIEITLEAYGNGQMMKIECPKCGVSYDTNLDPVDTKEREGECR